MTQDISFKAGDVRIETIELISLEGRAFDISNFMIEINLYEDIYSPVLFGDIVVADAVNLITRLPIIGTELITIKARSAIYDAAATTYIWKTFQIYAVENRFLNNDREQMYTLKFVSQEAFRDNASTISRPFTGLTSTLAADIFDEYISTERWFEKSDKTELLVADTPHQSNVKYTSNFWTPIQNMNFLAKRAVGKDLVGADYLFFESNKNFYFTSVENLCATQQTRVYDEFMYLPDGVSIPRRQGSGITYYSPELPDEYVRIEDMTLPKTIDALDSYQTGTYGASLRAYDFTTKKHSEYTYLATENFGEFFHTEPGNPMPPNIYPNAYAQRIWKPFNSTLHGEGKGYGNHASGGDAFDILIDQSYDDKLVSRELSRMTYFNSMNQYKFTISLPGRTDIEVGNMIRVVYPAPQVKDGKGQDYESLIDRLLTGNFLVTAIHHKIDIGQHKMILEIVKNGLREDLFAIADGGEPS